MSRYKVYKWPGIYPGIVILLTAVERSGFVKHYDPVLVAGVKAKTMTSLLIIPALLAFRFFLSKVKVNSQWSMVAVCTPVFVSPDFNILNFVKYVS